MPLRGRSRTSRRAVLSTVALATAGGCLSSPATQEAQLREQWQASDEVPDQDIVNREDSLESTVSFDEISPMMPSFTPLIGALGERTNRHYEIGVEAPVEIDVFVLDEYDPDDGEALVEYMDSEFSYVPEYSATGTRSHSAFVFVPDDDSYTLAADYRDVPVGRRHLENSIQLDISISGYYYLPFEVYKERRLDD